jgi:recombination protein RecR
MGYYPESIINLIDNFAMLPGIGRKTAERLAMHVLKKPGSQAQKLADSIIDVKKKVRFCPNCFSLSDKELCDICSDPMRNKSILCVVEHYADMIVIEKSNSFKGLYHILAGALSPIDGITPDSIRIKELFARLQGNCVKEIILATSTGVDGETTAAFIAKKLKDMNMNIKLSRIASGVPVGGDIKYVDQVTLKKAMDARNEI